MIDASRHPVVWAVVFALVCLGFAIKASADPMALRIVNNDPEQTIEAARVCLDDLCREVDVTCAPEQTCRLPELAMPTGCYEATAQTMAGGLWSEPSDVVLNLAFDPVLCHDATADGMVRTDDFTSFFDAFSLF